MRTLPINRSYLRCTGALEMASKILEEQYDIAVRVKAETSRLDNNKELDKKLETETLALYVCRIYPFKSKLSYILYVGMWNYLYVSLHARLLKKLDGQRQSTMIASLAAIALQKLEPCIEIFTVVLFTRSLDAVTCRPSSCTCRSLALLRCSKVTSTESVAKYLGEHNGSLVFMQKFCHVTRSLFAKLEYKS